ncbi:Phenazine biosynthesis PhzF protein [Melia azedarach]|uniref:Phenazine biosynthesis PhzF protein n=1 Tax=Melia azedarach TaxID=155640 RepID=A0ACC1YVE7_MELAZ|nr:Phenazine biosynthesis PhzF protein [Melia azedarach]
MAKKLVQYFVVDAFTDSAFKGNPAAVCLLEEEKDEKWLQLVASEFNVSQTCYLTLIDDSPNPRFRLRWFTPVAEVELCGHATLAAAHTLFSRGLVNSNVVEFVTLSGFLTAKKVPDVKAANDSNSQNGEAQECSFIELDFPPVPTTNFNSDEVSLIQKAFGVSSTSIVEMKITTTSKDVLVVLPSAKSVTEVQPRFDEILNCPGRGIIVSALAPPESGFDFYSRFFAPKVGINEDPVCGSAHCALATYWSQKLGKHDFVAFQASPRSGILNIHYDEQKQRVLLRGNAVTVMEGSLLV